MASGVPIDVPAISLNRVRQNYLAIAAAAIVCFLIEAAWYSFFLAAWVSGIGRPRTWLLGTSISPLAQFLQYSTALIAAALLAAGISRVTQLTGLQTAKRGMAVAALLWAAFVLTTWATEYVFELRPFSLLAINAGVWLVGMVLMGAIVGAWRKE